MEHFDWWGHHCMRVTFWCLFRNTHLYCLFSSLSVRLCSFTFDFHKRWHPWNWRCWLAISSQKVQLISKLVFHNNCLIILILYKGLSTDVYESWHWLLSLSVKTTHLCWLDSLSPLLLRQGSFLRHKFNVSDSLSRRQLCLLNQFCRTSSDILLVLKVLHSRVIIELKVVYVVRISPSWALLELVAQDQIILITDASRVLHVLASVPLALGARLSPYKEPIVLHISDFAIFYLLWPVLGKHCLAFGPIFQVLFDCFVLVWIVFAQEAGLWV